MFFYHIGNHTPLFLIVSSVSVPHSLKQMAHRAKLGKSARPKHYPYIILCSQMTSKKIKQKYNQSLQLSVTEHFNKTILCIVLLILFTPY